MLVRGNYPKMVPKSGLGTTSSKLPSELLVDQCHGRSTYDVSMDIVRTSVTLQTYAPSALADGASPDETLKFMGNPTERFRKVGNPTIIASTKHDSTYFLFACVCCYIDAFDLMRMDSALVGRTNARMASSLALGSPVLSAQPSTSGHIVTVVTTTLGFPPTFFFHC